MEESFIIYFLLIFLMLYLRPHTSSEIDTIYNWITKSALRSATCEIITIPTSFIKSLGHSLQRF
jgi:hypothetical protein